MIVLLAGVLAAQGCTKPENQGAARPREVAVAAAADLKFVWEELARRFHQLHPDIQVRATFGSSGGFYAQLVQKAPFDLFLSADTDYCGKLVEQGLAARDTQFLYAIGRIVVWAPNSSPLDLDKLGIAALAEPSVKKVSLANPRHAPYGRAAAPPALRRRAAARGPGAGAGRQAAAAAG